MPGPGRARSEYDDELIRDQEERERRVREEEELASAEAPAEPERTCEVPGPEAAR